MPKYRKKPVVIDAEVFSPGMEDGSHCERGACKHKADSKEYCECDGCDYIRYYIDTLEGNMSISEGDYIITGVRGERYPCKPDIFKETYTRVV